MILKVPQISYSRAWYTAAGAHHIAPLREESWHPSLRPQRSATGSFISAKSPPFTPSAKSCCFYPQCSRTICYHQTVPSSVYLLWSSCHCLSQVTIFSHLGPIPMLATTFYFVLRSCPA